MDIIFSISAKIFFATISIYDKKNFRCQLTKDLSKLLYRVVVQLPSHIRLCNTVDCSTPGLPVPYHLPEFAQVHVHFAEYMSKKDRSHQSRVEYH